jgi:hypothetical protein
MSKFLCKFFRNWFRSDAYLAGCLQMRVVVMGLDAFQQQSYSHQLHAESHLGTRVVFMILTNILVR